MNDLYTTIRSLDTLDPTGADRAARAAITTAASMIFPTAAAVHLLWDVDEHAWTLCGVQDAHGDPLIEAFSTDPGDTLADLVDLISAHLISSQDEITLEVAAS